METLSLLWDKITQLVTIIHFPNDIIDIAIVAFLTYKLLNISRSRTATQIVKVVVVLLVAAYLAEALNLNVLSYIISKVIEIALFAVVVVFQPELRRLMERFGSGSIKGLFIPQRQMGETERVIEETVDACRIMSRQKTGALIVFERRSNLEEYFKTGTVIDAEVSSELLKNVFFPKAALHDGAVVVRDDRLAAAGCVLPLTENPNLSRELGTRHRAAIGISERSDALVVVVSEETGVVSCAMGGQLRRYLTLENLTNLLRAELLDQETKPVHHRIRDFFRRANKPKQDKDSHHEEE